MQQVCQISRGYVANRQKGHSLEEKFKTFQLSENDIIISYAVTASSPGVTNVVHRN